MNIRLTQTQDKNIWDAYVNQRRDAAPYCLFAWKEAVEEAYGHKPCYLLAEEQGTVQGVFPLVIFHTPFLGQKLVSLPFCDVGDVSAENNELQEALLAEAMVVAKKMKVKEVVIRSSNKHLLGKHCSGWHVRVQTDKVRMLLDLPDSSEELWKSFKSKLRSQVNKAKKNGLTFRWGDRNDLDAFYHVFSRNMHALGSPVHGKFWIEHIIARYGDAARMGLVYKDDQPVGCGIILCTKHSVSIPWASTLREYNRLSPNMLLYWNFLKYAADNGKESFDFGRSTLNEGTYRFKKQWGSGPVPLYWYSITPTEIPGTINRKASGKRDLLAGLWGKMPLPAANILGSAIRKYISL